jgi:hypothetical protein
LNHADGGQAIGFFNSLLAAARHADRLTPARIAQAGRRASARRALCSSRRS